jgi:glucokinase
MNKAAFLVLGIDIGGTKTSAGIVRFPSGDLLHQESVPTNPKRAGEAVLRDIAALADRVAAQGRRSGLELAGLGIGVCELVDGNGRILSHSCLAFDENQMREALGHLGPMMLDADVRAAALAEALFGAGKRFKIFVYVTIGTGIAACLMLDGVPYLGARGATGTMASSPLNFVCNHCGQTSQQTLEEVASGPGLVTRFNRVRPGAALRGQDVLEAALRGDLDALRVVQSAGEALGSTVGLLVNVLDPEALVIGGGLGLSEGPFWDSFIASTRQHIWSDVHRNLPILRAGTGTHAGTIGAAVNVWKRSQQSSLENRA